MSKNYYSEIHLHLTWHTILSRPLLTETVEPLAWAALREKATELGDVIIHEIGGTPTHVHLAVSIEPTVLISELFGSRRESASGTETKGSSVANWVRCRQFWIKGPAVGCRLHSQSEGTSRTRGNVRSIGVHWSI